MVTGSHNPPDYNGFKMVLGGKPFFGEQIQRAGRAWRRPATWWTRPWRRNAASMSPPSMSRACWPDWDGGDRMLKVVWDNGNGAAGEVLQQLVAGLPGEHIVLNGDDRRHVSRRIIPIRRCRRTCSS